MKADTQQLVGKLLVDGAGERDAIHIAVEPVVAGEPIEPGTPVALGASGKAYEAWENLPALGIADPFLTESILSGSRFYMFLFPNTITSLRHVWEHNAFPDPVGIDLTTCRPVDLQTVAVSEAWLRDYAEIFKISYEALLDAGTDFAETDEYYVLNFDTPEEARDLAPDFWRHYQVVTGRKAPDDCSDTPFSCAC